MSQRFLRLLATSLHALYDADMKSPIIELTENQIEAVEQRTAMPPQVVNPRTNETFVLLRMDEYERLRESDYDDSPWTKSELQALAWEAGKSAEWDDMNEYDDLPGKP